MSWSRRKFIVGTVAAGVAAGCVHRGGQSRPKTVALLATVVRKYAHAQHFVDRFLEGYGWQGRHHYPAVKLVSLYVDQFPEDDLARERSKRHGVPIYPTVAEALTLGGSKLAVDGVVIIGEHGRYPRNEKGQVLYPRHKFFREAVDVFEASGRAVPMFQDKHLSTDWSECVAQVETAHRPNGRTRSGCSLPRSRAATPRGRRRKVTRSPRRRSIGCAVPARRRSPISSSTTTGFARRCSC